MILLKGIYTTAISFIQSMNMSTILKDGFNRHHNYLRISVTERCSFRCQYCMPEEGVPLTPHSKLLTNEEIIRLVSLFVKLGVDKVRMTGGEPLIRENIVKLTGALSSFESLKTIGLTTNGLVLYRKLSDLKNAGLNALNISLDTLVREKFEFITRRSGLKLVLKSIDAALDMNYHPLKVNCVVIKGFNDDELINFVKLTDKKDVDVRFIEYCPFTGNKWNYEKMVPYSEMLLRIQQEFPNLIRLPDRPNDTSKAYKVPGFKGQIGFITSMTKNFCSSCNRLRITADGNLKVCLFGNEEVSLRDPLRQRASEEELLNLIHSALQKKRKQHAEILSDVPFKLVSTSGKQNILSHDRWCQSIMKILEHKTISTQFRTNILPTRSYSICLSHVNEKGKISMVNVSSKVKSMRTAQAEARIYLGALAFDLAMQNKIEKGDILSVANIAGIMAGKKTSELIPLCHSIQIDNIGISFEFLLEDKEILIKSVVTCVDRTGAEMEALTSATVAALTIYDMCKAVSKDMVIKDVHLSLKTGGKKDFKKL